MRYVASIEFYIHADSDQDVMNKLQAIIDNERAKYDNDCGLLSVVEQNFGEIGNRPVFGIKQ